MTRGAWLVLVADAAVVATVLIGIAASSPLSDAMTAVLVLAGWVCLAVAIAVVLGPYLARRQPPPPPEEEK